MSHFISIKINLTIAEKNAAVQHAKAQGYSFGGWVGNLIKEQLTEAENSAASGSRNVIENPLAPSSPPSSLTPIAGEGGALSEGGQA